MTTARIKTWNVYVNRNGTSQFIGTVAEANEENARCAALHKYGVPDDESKPADGRYIGETENFSVSTFG